MIPESDLRELVRRIHSLPQLSGCPIAFQGNRQSRVLHPGICVTPLSERVIVVIEELEVTDPALLVELERFAAGQGISPEGAPNPTIVTNASVLGPELIGAGISCTLTVVSAVGIAAGVAAEIPSGGTSTFLVVASWVGFATSAIQCANGIVRVAAIAAAPDDNTLQRWDQNAFYSNFILLVDALGVASGVASLPAASRNLLAVLARQSAFAARRPSFESLRAMNRAERLRVIGEVFEQASRTTAGRDALILAAREAGVGATTIQSTTGLSVRGARTLTRVISEETTRRLTASLRDVTLGVLGPVFSAMPSRLIGSASGSMNYIINLIDTGAPPGSTTL